MIGVGRYAGRIKFDESPYPRRGRIIESLIDSLANCADASLNKQVLHPGGRFARGVIVHAGLWRFKPVGIEAQRRVGLESSVPATDGAGGRHEGLTLDGK